MTSGQDTWSARCVETRTAGAAGGPGKPTGSDPGRAPRSDPTFERFADDAVVHCVTERQARHVWAALAERLENVGLRLHPDKTKIVYCGDSNRKRKYDCISFTFLGYAFRPRESKSGRTGTIFTSFQPAMSPVALKSKSQELRRWRMHRRTSMDLGELAEWLNPIVRGWMNY